MQRSALPAGCPLQLKREERFNGCSNVSKSNLLGGLMLRRVSPPAGQQSPARNCFCCLLQQLRAPSSLTCAVAHARATLRPQRDAFDAKQTRADALHTKSSQ